MADTMHQSWNGGNSKHSTATCQKIKNVTTFMLSSLEKSLKDHYNIIPSYTQHQFHNKSPTTVLNEWSQHRLPMKHAFSHLVETNYTIQPDKNKIQAALHPISNQTIIKEMQNAYRSLKKMHNAFLYVNQTRNSSYDQLFSEMRGNAKSLSAINDFFNETASYVRYVLIVMTESLEGLKIQIPSEDMEVTTLCPAEDRAATVAVTNKYRNKCIDGRVLEWLLVREYMGLLRLLHVIFTIFSDELKC